MRLWVGDTEEIQADVAAYDTVFDFVIIHHVPAWRNALREAARVLKPGGRFYSEAVVARVIGTRDAGLSLRSCPSLRPISSPTPRRSPSLPSVA